MGRLQQQKFIFIHRGLGKDNVLHIYDGILLGHKKEGNCVICSNTDGPGDYLSEVNQKDKCHMIRLITGILKMMQMNKLTDLEHKLKLTKGGRWERGIN